MGQELLNIDVATPAALKGKKVVVEQPLEQGKQDVKPFSSELNEQVDKRNNHDDKPLSAHESQSKDKVDSNVVAESEESESGKILPDENSEDENALLAAELVEEETDNLDAEALVVPFAQTVISESTELEEGADSESDKKKVINSQKTLNGQAAVVGERAAVKLAEANTADAETKQINSAQTPVLRSDILQALKKHDKLSENIPAKGNKVEGEQATSFFSDNKKTDKLLQVTGDSQLNDSQKIAKLINQAQSEQLTLRSVNERGVEGFSSALTKAPSFASSATNAAPGQIQSTSASTVLTMQPSVQSEAWGKVLSSRVVWMANEGVQRAELRLNPANLGPVEVKMSSNNEQVSVSFVAQHAATRDALEQALPKLKESFQENGMDLAQADVSEQESEEESDEPKDESTLTHLSSEQDDSEQEDSRHVTEQVSELGVSVRV